MHQRRVRVSAEAKAQWTSVTVVTAHGALQNTVERIKMQFAAIRTRILSGLCYSHVLFNVPSFRFLLRNFRLKWFCRGERGEASVAQRRARRRGTGEDGGPGGRRRAHQRLQTRTPGFVGRHGCAPSHCDEHPKKMTVAQAANPRSDIHSEVRSLQRQHLTLS